MSNFNFLKTEWPDIFETAHEAVQNVNSPCGGIQGTVYITVARD